MGGSDDIERQRVSLVENLGGVGRGGGVVFLTLGGVRLGVGRGRRGRFPGGRGCRGRQPGGDGRSGGLECRGEWYCFVSERDDDILIWRTGEPK